MRRRLSAFARVGTLALVASSCGSRTEISGDLAEGDGGSPQSNTAALRDAHVEEATDAASDAGRDAGVDGAADAGSDAGVTECTATAPTLLATRPGGLDQIEIDANAVYFHDVQGIWRVPKSGGTATLVASMEVWNSPILESFVVDSSGVTWWQPVAGGVTNVLRAPALGGAPSRVAVANGTFYHGVAGAAGEVYVWNGGPQNVDFDRVHANGTVTTLTAAPWYTETALFDGKTVFIGSTQGVFRWTGTSSQRVGSGGGYPVDMKSDATTLYIASSTDGIHGSVLSLPKTGGATTTLWSGSVAIGGIAIDATRVFVADRAGTGLVVMNKDGTGLTSLTAPEAQGTIDVAVDDRCIYWSAALSGSRGAVFAAPR